MFDAGSAKFRGVQAATPLKVDTITGGDAYLTLSLDSAADITTTNLTATGTITGNATSATKLQTARTINNVAFDGTGNITVADGTKLPLAGGTLTGQLICSRANNTADNQGQIYLTGATANRIDFNVNGLAVPSFTTRLRSFCIQVSTLRRRTTQLGWNPAHAQYGLACLPAYLPSTGTQA